MLKRSLFYHVDKIRDKNVPLKHRGTLSVRRNHTRSLRKSIFKFSFVLMCTRCSNMLCCDMLRKALSLSLSLSLSLLSPLSRSLSLSHSLTLCLSLEGPYYLKKMLYAPFSVWLEAFVNCSNKITWNVQHLFTSFMFAPNYREQYG